MRCLLIPGRSGDPTREEEPVGIISYWIVIDDHAPLTTVDHAHAAATAVDDHADVADPARNFATAFKKEQSPFSASSSGTRSTCSLPVYTPPRKLSPRARVGGEMRGTGGGDPEIQALVPDHVGLTINQTPALNWFLSKPTAYSVRFTLIDNRSIKPIYEATIPSPKKAGIQTINLKEMGLTLEPDVQYRWYISVIRNPDSPSQDIVAGGVIERCEFNACLVEASPHLTCSTQSVQDNARQGFWYDAMACLCTLIDARPTDAPLRRMRAALLKQVGLHGVAEWDLRSITTATR